jgi:hypothetical protein
MKTISYNEDEWHTLWDRLAKEHGTALYLEKELGFTLRKKTEVISCDDAPAGYDRIVAVYLDFEHDKDYTMFVLKYK